MTDYAVLAETKPWDIVEAALACQAKGEPLSADLSAGVEVAGPLLVGASMVRLGCDVEEVMRQFNDREYSIRLTYDGSTGEIGVSIEFDDYTISSTQGEATE